MAIDIKQQIKEVLLEKNITMTDLVNLLNENKPDNEKTTLQSLNNKLTRGTIKYSEILEIAQVLKYNILWQNAEQNQMATTKIKKIYEFDVKNAFPLLSKAVTNGSIKYGSITGSKAIDNFDWEGLKNRYDLEEQFEFNLQFIVNHIIANANLNELPVKIQSDIKAYKDMDDMPIGYKFIFIYRVLYIIVAKQIVNSNIIEFLSQVRKMYNNGGITNLDDSVLSDLINDSNYLINFVFKID
jgi:hypothetical protein